MIPAHAPRKPDRAWLAIVTLILFGAFALRLWNLGTQSLWHDEAWSVFSGYHPLAWGQLGTDVNAPPIFYMTLGLWQRVSGDSVWAMRCWSALLGTITVAVAFLIACRWFSPSVAALTGVFVAVSPMLWVFSQEIRAYVAMPLLALILLLLSDGLLSSGSRRMWLWLLTIELITLYVHNLSVPLVAWLNVTVILAWLLQRHWRRLILWLIAQVGVFVLYLPWLATQQPTGTLLNTPPKVTPALLWDIWQSYFTGIKAMVGADSLLMALTAAFGVIGLAAVIAALIRSRSRRTRLLLSQAILLPIFELGIILAAHIDFHPRYFIVGIPATLILIGVGLNTLPWRVPTIRLITAVGASAVAIAIMVRMTSVLYSSPIYQHDDFRAIAQRYARLGTDDAIIIPYGWEPTLDYYSRKMNFTARFVNVPLHSDGETIIKRLQADLKNVHRAEVLTWYQLPADVRGAYSCILGAMGQHSDDLTVSGIKTDTYESLSSNMVQPLIREGEDEPFFGPIAPEGPGSIIFGPIKVIYQIGIWGSQKFCLVTQWQLIAPTSENLRLVARLYNYLGWELGKTDTQMLNDRQLPTSLWATAQPEYVFSLIPSPEGTSTFDRYPVTVSIYDQQMPNGYRGRLSPELEKIQTETPSPQMHINRVIPPAQQFDPPIQPTSQDIMLAKGLYLHRKALPPDNELVQGQRVYITLEWWHQWSEYWNVQDNIEFVVQGNGWHSPTPFMVYPQSKILTWHQFWVPATATGQVTIKVVAANGNSVTLGEYTIKEFLRQFSEPSMLLTQRVNANFFTVSTLIGVTVSQSPIDNTQSMLVTLLWKASATPSTAYKVFVHLLDTSGQIIAQSDSEPVGGTRPTWSWVNGEYLIDQHRLTFNRTDYHGSAKIEVGLYDPSSQIRVSLDNGEDHVVLPVSFEVK